MSNLEEFVKNNVTPIAFLGATVVITYATAKIAGRSAATKALREFTKLPVGVTITKDFFIEAGKHKLI